MTGNSRLYAGVLDNIVELEIIPNNRIDTSDATAVASDILKGKTAYANGQKIFGSLIPEIIPNSMFTNKILKFSSDIFSIKIPTGEYKNLSQYDIIFFGFSYGTKYGSDMIFLLYDLSIGCGICGIYGQDTEMTGDSVTIISNKSGLLLATISEKIGNNLYMNTSFHSGDGTQYVSLKFDNKTVYNTDTSGGGIDDFFVLSYLS